MVQPPKRLSIFAACLLPEEVKADLRRISDIVFADDIAPDQPARTLLPGRKEPIVMISVQEPLDAATIASLPAGVRAIATYSAGHEHLDLAAAGARGIAVFSLPDALSEAVAEVGMFLLLGAARRATESIDLIRSRAWPGWSATQLNGFELFRKHLGILGMGRIGRVLAQRARGFDMTIHYSNRRRLTPELEAGALYHVDPREMFGQIDALVLLAPSSPETRGFLNSERISWLKRGAIVVNIARGNLIVDDDLIAALRTGHLFAAGLDVFNDEPNLDPRYFDLPNVFMLPHIGSSTIETRRRMAAALIEQLRTWIAGGTPSSRLV
jgi:lactate dehydrogenase-like 2-hydroxyacid dehydrogenase